MDFSHSARATELIGRLESFMDSYVYPNEVVLERQLAKRELRKHAP